LWIYIAFTYISLVRGSFFLGRGLPLWFDDLRLSEWKNYVVDLSLMFFLTVSTIRTRRQMGILLVAMCLGSLLVTKSFHSTIQSRDFSAFSDSLREEGPLGFAGVNGLAAFAAQVSIFVTGLFLAERRSFARLGYLGVIAANVYCLIYALSRGGYAAFLAGILYLGVVRSRLLLVGLALFLLGWQGLVPPAVRERIYMTQDEQGEVEHSAAVRFSLWDEALQVFQADPVFGTGFNTYEYGSHVEGFGDTHNVFVKVLVETGVTGLVIFLAIFGELFQIGYRLYRTASDSFFKSIGLGLSGLMVAALFANFFGDRWMYFQITGYTYAFAALAVRAQQLSEESEDESKAEQAGADLAEVPV
jgi:O-antigen ligase